MAARGENASRAKLTNEQVEEIRRVYVPHSRTFGARALGRKYGVHHTTIVAAASGEHYADVGGTYGEDY